MGNNYYIQDTCEVIIEDIKTKEILAIGCASATSLNLTEDSTPIIGGIGAKTCYTIKSNKSVELSISSNTLMAPLYDMMTGGTTEDDVTSEVQAVGFAKVIDDTGTKTIELPADLTAVTSIRLEDISGKQKDVLVTAGKAEVPVTFKADEGDELMYFYMKTIKGSKFTLDATKFASRCKVTYRSLAYDVATEQVYADIWWEFPSVSPQGNLELAFTAGEATQPTLTFTAVTPRGSDVLAYKYEQLRPEFVRP